VKYKACLLALTAAVLWPGRLFAQPIPWDDQQLYQRLGLTEQQVSSLQEVAAREDRVVREAQAELNIYKAQLEKLLLDPDPDMKQVERLLRSSNDSRLKSQMAVIRRRVAMRKIMGEQKWEQFLRGLRAWRTRQERRPGGPQRSAR
jgi:hypothetical protein